MPDFPTGLPDIANASPSETLFTMHAGASHVTATNRILTNVLALATKLGTGTSAPGATAGLLRRTAAGTSAWGQIAAGDHAAGSIATADLASSSIVSLSQVFGTTSSPTTGSGTPADLPEMTITPTLVGGGVQLLIFECIFSSNTIGANSAFSLLAGGAQIMGRDTVCFLANARDQIVVIGSRATTPGPITCKVQWFTTAPTTTAIGVARSLISIEFKR